MSSEDKPGFIFGDQWPRRTSVVKAVPRKRQTTDWTPGKMLSRQLAASISWMLAVFVGMLFQANNFVETVPAASGATIVMHPPTTGFWVAIGVGFVSMLILVYATGGGQ